MVNGELSLLTQLFASLVENALRHAGKNACIAMRVTRVSVRVTAILADDGPDVPADLLIPGQAAPSFRNDAAPLFRSLVAP